MSDEELGAGASDETAGAPVPAELGDDTTLAGRLETIHRTMSTLGMRIDALVTSTTSYRSALTDRLAEYADLVTKLTRAQASDLDEYRRTNERTLADLRRGLSTSEETLERVGARIESMLTDTESADDSSRRVLAEVRSILESQENLGRFLTESLDQFGEQVMGRLAASEQAAADQLQALQAAVSDVEATPDPTLALVDDRLAGIEDRLAVVASNDTAAAMGSRFETLHAALDALGHELRADAGSVDTGAVVERLSRMEDQLASAGTATSDSFGEIAGLRAKIDAILETTASESGAVTTTLEQLKETLQDLASGEVVGALWDEVRQVRATVEALVDRDEHTADPAVFESLRSEVTGLTESVRDLLRQAEVVDDEDAPEADAGYLAALAADVAALRSELSEGLVVEPSDAFGTSVEQLRKDLVGFGERLSVVTELRESVSELRDATELRDAAEGGDRSAADQEPLAVDLPEELEGELRAVRAGVDGIIARLDEGLVLDDVAAPAEPSAELADQVATLRDQVSVEFERVRQLLDSVGGDVDLTPLTARLDRLHDDLAELEVGGRAPDDGAPAGEPAAAGDSYATVDPDVIDLLREEIRTAGSVSDELVETLSTELKALRRRIRLRAEGEIFSDEQLQIIADAVAAKLGE